MHVQEMLRLLEILAWPVVAIFAIVVVRPHLSKLLSGAKLKLKIAGQSIETTLPEIREVLEEQAGDVLSTDQIEYLRALRVGARQYTSGIESADRKFLRPLRNAGLIATIPSNAFLSEATAVEISALGRLFLRAS